MIPCMKNPKACLCILYIWRYIFVYWLMIELALKCVRNSDV